MDKSSPLEEILISAVLQEGKRQGEKYGFLNFNELRKRFPKINTGLFEHPILIEEFVRGYQIAIRRRIN